MKVIECRNVHEALPLGLQYLRQHGIRRESRNGPVLVSPGPVTTVYRNPLERVIFHPTRDANPAFHLYESLWMLEGRDDVEGPARYAKQLREYSDDGRTMHGAYGHRWRKKWGDQLEKIARRLREDPTDRRCVLQMWGATADLDRPGKDVPCNVTATFQRDHRGHLNLVVFNRSNDIIWGAYGANAVQFGTLLEYVALAIGCEVGTYEQVSVNYHAYLSTMMDLPLVEENPYDTQVFPLKMGKTFKGFDTELQSLMIQADTSFVRDIPYGGVFFRNVGAVLSAHDLFRTLAAPERYDQALKVLASADQSLDWIVAMTQWIERRKAKWEAKMNPTQETPTLGYNV